MSWPRAHRSESLLGNAAAGAWVLTRSRCAAVGRTPRAACPEARPTRALATGSRVACSAFGAGLHCLPKGRLLSPITLTRPEAPTCAEDARRVLRNEDDARPGLMVAPVRLPRSGAGRNVVGASCAGRGPSRTMLRRQMTTALPLRQPSPRRWRETDRGTSPAWRSMGPSQREPWSDAVASGHSRR